MINLTKLNIDKQHVIHKMISTLTELKCKQLNYAKNNAISRKCFNLKVCFNFVLKIVNLLQSAHSTYEKLAKYNATILITVKWECIVDGWSSRLLIMANSWITSTANHYNCKPFHWLKKKLMKIIIKTNK